MGTINDACPPSSAVPLPPPPLPSPPPMIRPPIRPPAPLHHIARNPAVGGDADDPDDVVGSPSALSARSPMTLPATSPCAANLPDPPYPPIPSRRPPPPRRARRGRDASSCVGIERVGRRNGPPTCSPRMAGQITRGSRLAILDLVVGLPRTNDKVREVGEVPTQQDDRGPRERRERGGGGSAPLEESDDHPLVVPPLAYDQVGVPPAEERVGDQPSGTRERRRRSTTTMSSRAGGGDRRRTTMPRDDKRRRRRRR